MDPLTYGDYPLSMRSLVGERLPKFSQEQSAMLKGSTDFIGLNYYTANYVADSPHLMGPGPSCLTDARTNISSKITIVVNFNEFHYRALIKFFFFGLCID